MLDIATAGSIFADLSATKSHLFNIIPEKKFISVFPNPPHSHIHSPWQRNSCENEQSHCQTTNSHLEF